MEQKNAAAFGSERTNKQIKQWITVPGFLSCLCGSERDMMTPVAADVFLSCLCGSERKPVQDDGGGSFLSCLCGSEPSARALCRA